MNNINKRANRIFVSHTNSPEVRKVKAKAEAVARSELSVQKFNVGAKASSVAEFKVSYAVLTLAPGDS